MNRTYMMRKNSQATAIIEVKIEGSAGRGKTQIMKKNHRKYRKEQRSENNST